MTRVRLAAVLAAGAIVSGCATIIQGTTQPVSVSSVPEEGAQCTLKNSEGTWFLTTPGSTTVHKTKNNMTIDCTKPGFAPGHTVAISHFGGTTVGNVIVGGAIGLTVDAVSGANFYYDSPITVDLGEAAPSTVPPPVAAAPTGSTGAAPASAPQVLAKLSAAPPAAASPSAATAAPPTVATVTTNPEDASLHLDHKFPNYQPAYPDAAQVNGEQGNVVLDVQVTSSGKVRNVKIDQSSGFGDLDNAAIAGVLRWRFVPAEYGTDWTKVTIAYRLPTAIIVPPKGATTGQPAAPPR